MENSSKSYLKRKEAMVYKDFDTAFTSYANTLTKIANIMQWTVTIIAGFLVVLFTSVVSFPQLTIVAFLCLLAFSILELRERSSLKFNKKQILYLEEMFHLKDDNEYWKKIDSYEFRDLRLRKFGRKKKIKLLFRSIKDLELIVWALFWIIIWIVFGLVKCYL